MRSRSALAVAALLAAVLPVDAADTLGRVQASGSFKIGYRVDARPFSYRSASGEPAGYVVDVCREVADAVRQGTGVGRLDIA